MEQVGEVFINFLKTFGTNILEAVVFLLAGIIVIKLSIRVIKRIMHRTNMEGTASSFILSLIKAVLALLLFFGTLSILNINTSSLVAIVAASGLAIGLALQNSLSNITSGIILLFTKPFKENDYVKIGSSEGVVKRIRITTTQLTTPDGISIIVPNATVVSTEIQNYTNLPNRRLDVIVSAAYEADIDKVKNSLQKLIKSDNRILTIPEPDILVSQLGESSVSYKVRVWVSNENYWPINNGFLEKVLAQFKQDNIEIPYNRLKVIMSKEEK
jgi:small conductance mechanosensitive channel